jgi:hypothetical protein
MNVAVVEPTSTLTAAAAGREGESQKASHQSEWIDPEGDDWFSSIYRELTQEPMPETIDRYASESEHWFG